MAIAEALLDLLKLHKVALIAPVARGLLDLDHQQIVVVGSRHMHDDVGKDLALGQLAFRIRQLDLLGIYVMSIIFDMDLVLGEMRDEQPRKRGTDRSFADIEGDDLALFGVKLLDCLNDDGTDLISVHNAHFPIAHSIIYGTILDNCSFKEHIALTGDYMATAVKAIDRKELTGPALRTFFNIAEAWDLSEVEQMNILGLDSRSTFHNWKRGDVAALSKDALERISYVMGIYKGLQILVPQTADAWVRKPNKAAMFGGKPAIDRMASGNVSDLYVVRQYIDGQRG